MGMEFFDIHCHVLPKIDDGSQSWEETMKMVTRAHETGTTQLAITHHIINPKDFERENEIVEKYEELKERLKAASIPMKLHLGSELYYAHDLDLNHRIATYNDNKRYFLVEFPMQGIPKYCDEKFFEFIVDNRNPILAHPERNLGIIKNPMRAFELVQRGVLLQLNSGSLTGMYGEQVRQTAFLLLKAGLIHLVGSDGHNIMRRPLIIDEAYDYILSHYGERKAMKIFYENPWRAMNGDDIEIDEPMPVEAPAKKGFFKRLGF